MSTEFIKKLAEIENNGEMGVGIAFMGGPGTPATPDESISNITDVTKPPVGDGGGGGRGRGTHITVNDIGMAGQGARIIPNTVSWYTSSVHFGINESQESEEPEEEEEVDDYDDF